MRINSLDYFRALLAIGVMLSHYSLWIDGVGTAASVNMRLEIYRVSMFYLLSGLLLFYFYHQKLVLNSKEILFFIKKRVMRLAPLFYLATVLTIVLSRSMPDLLTLFLNFSGLFAFYNWDSAVVYGGWSVGNEIVFYLAFPLLLFFFKKSRAAFFGILFLLFLLYYYFAFHALDVSKPFISQWKTYINPLNQIFVFGAGMAIGLIFKDVKMKPIYATLLLLLSLAVFYFYPLSGERIVLVTGLPRMVFTLASIGLLISVFKLRIKFPAILHQPLSAVAKASYGVYLLHPVIYRVVMKFWKVASNYGINIPLMLTLAIAALSTLLISYFVYLKFELLFIKSTKKLQPKPSH